MADTTDEKLKQRLKDLYDDSREYSLGQISEASGMALDRIKELEAKLADAERVARYETDIAQQALDQMRAAEAKLAEAEAERDALHKRNSRTLNAARKDYERAESAEAKLAKVTDDCDDLQIALASARKQLERYIGEAEAALPAVYRLGLDDAHRQVVISGEKHAGLSASRVTDAICAAIRDLPTPTAAELMARIQTGKKDD